MRKIFIINGRGGCGKDTFVDMIKELDDSVMSISSVGEIKEISKKYFGWRGEKEAQDRKMLSDLKILQTDYCDGPFNYMMAALKQYPNNHIFFHIREPEEIKKFKSATGAITVLVERDGFQNKEYGNMADDNVSSYRYDSIIINSTIPYLKIYAKSFYDMYIKEKKHDS